MFYCHIFLWRLTFRSQECFLSHPTQHIFMFSFPIGTTMCHDSLFQHEFYVLIFPSTLSFLQLESFYQFAFRWSPECFLPHPVLHTIMFPFIILINLQTVSVSLFIRIRNVHIPFNNPLSTIYNHFINSHSTNKNVSFSTQPYIISCFFSPAVDDIITLWFIVFQASLRTPNYFRIALHSEVIILA